MKTRSVAGLVRAVVLGTAGAGCSASAGQASILALGTLPGGNNISRAKTVSDDGSIVFGEAITAGASPVPFRWTRETGMEFLEMAPGTFGYNVLNTSPSGEYLVGAAGTIGEFRPEGFIWTRSEGVRTVGDLPTGDVRTQLRRVTDSGVAYGESWVENAFGDSVPRAVRWTESGGLEPIPLPPGDEALAISQVWGELSDGRIVGNSPAGTWFYDPATGQHEILPDARRMSNFSSDGSFAVGTPTNLDILAAGAAYWTRETGTQFLPLLSPGLAGRVTAMNGDGSLIAGTQGMFEVVWVDQGAPMTIDDYLTSMGVDVEGWRILDISDISPDGKTLVGEATREGWAIGRIEAVVITLGICPADVDRDGELTPDDFTAWLAAYDARSPRCDQNGDLDCTPSDYFAWVANYNACQ